MSKKTPIVAIIGRANVGKSSLFNALIRRREVIVAKEAGTTRDAIWQKVENDKASFWLVDTAGMKQAAKGDAFELTIQDQISQAADSADVILVVVDASVPPSSEDKAVAKIALKSQKQVKLVINKSDLAKNTSVEEFQSLGIRDIHTTSTTQSRGIAELRHSLFESVPRMRPDEEAGVIKVSLIGRPNVGKSSLFNTLLQKQQIALVSPVAGTTRDVNKRTVKYHSQEIEFADTAGIRKKSKVEKGVESFSMLRSLSAIEDADICLLIIDSTEPSVQLEQKLAGAIKEANKGLVIVMSKWDAIDKDQVTRDKIARQIQYDFSFVPWAPLIFTSSETGQNVQKIFDLVVDIKKKQSRLFKTSELNRWLQNTVMKHQPAGLKNRHPTLRYIMQEDDNPTNFKIFGGQTKFLHWSYKRYLERVFRETYGYEGTAIKFWFFEQGQDANRRKRLKHTSQRTTKES